MELAPYRQADPAHMNHNVCHHVTAVDQLSKVVGPEASRHLLGFVTLAKPPCLCLSFLKPQTVAIIAPTSRASVRTRFNSLISEHLK